VPMPSLRHATTALVLFAAPAAVGFHLPMATPARATPISVASVPRCVACTPAEECPARQRSSAIAMAATAQSQPWSAGSMSRVARLLMVSLLGILLRAVPALAVSTARRTASSAGLPIGEIIKYGGVVGLFGAAYAFRREEVPILTETPMEEEQKPAPTAAAATEVDSIPATPSADSFDDSSLNSALFARMQQLSEERERADAEPEELPPPADSTDSWGEGSTAVLEPPKPSDAPAEPAGGGLLDDPPVDFPTGFPLVDGDFEPAPAASEEQIAMLKRMMGQ